MLITVIPRTVHTHNPHPLLSDLPVIDIQPRPPVCPAFLARFTSNTARTLIEDIHALWFSLTRQVCVGFVCLCVCVCVCVLSFCCAVLVNVHNVWYGHTFVFPTEPTDTIFSSLNTYS